MTISLPNQIEPLTTADAVEVDQNYTVIVDYLNTDVISRDGLVAMQAPLQLVGADPVSDDHATRKAYVDALLPVGTMMMYGAAAAPSGRWKLCDGSSLQTAAFPKLFAVLQYSYGGSGGTFNLPDMRHRVPIGLDAADDRFKTVGKKGGSYETSLVEHDHPISHDHPQFNTGNQNADHTHPIDHNHAAFNTSTDSGVHTHLGEFLATRSPDTGTPVSVFVTSGSSSSGNANVGGSNAADGDHRHFIDIPEFKGSSKGISANHQHPVNVPAFTGNSGKRGTAGIDQIPEYVTISYIIRTD